MAMIIRSDDQKQDLASSWNRPDRPFFAAGACHILAAAFLDIYPDSRYSAFHIKPSGAFRGGHVVVADANTVFDYHGYVDRTAYFDHLLLKMQRLHPGWSAQVLPLLASPSEWDFCRQYRHRHPSQFWQDPLPRAMAFVHRFRLRHPKN
jgi:hypothetical protein